MDPFIVSPSSVAATVRVSGLPPYSMEYEKVTSLPLMVPLSGTSPDVRLTVPDRESPFTWKMILNSRVPPGVFIDAFHSPATDWAATDWAETDGTAAKTARARDRTSVRMEGVPVIQG